MNLRILQAVICLTALFPSQITKAQKTEPIFEVKAGNEVANAKFLVQAASGQLITGTDLKLMAIDPEKKSVIWENNDFLALSEDDITVIEGTPFIKIERQKTLAITKNRNTYIIQANNGNIVYDSKGEGIKVRNTLILPQIGGLLMEVVKDGFLSVSFIDFATAKEAWTVPIAKEKSGGIGVGALKRAIKSHMSSAFNVAPLTDADGNLLLVYKKEIVGISKAGIVLWKKEFDENVDDAYISTGKKSLFVGYKKYIDKLNTADGSSELKEPIKMRDELNGITPMGNDYIVYNQAGINIMDADGNMKWKKDTKLGNVTDVRYTAGGILGIQQVKDDETSFFWVDKSGKQIWDQQAKGAFILAEPTEKGVMYVTSERANILTYEKGKDVWDRDIKLKGVPSFGTDADNKILYAYAKEKLHSFNFKDNSYKLVAENLELKKFNDEQEPLIFDIRNSGATVVISSNQNVLSVQPADGKVNYNNYFKDIGDTKKKLLRGLAVAGQLYGASQAFAGSFNANTGLANALNGKEGGGAQFMNGMNQQIAGQNLNADATQLFKEASKRYLASQATKENLYILSEMPEGNGLMVWNKQKGEATKKIYFSDATPVFIVDEATDRVYVMVGNTLKAYALN